MTDKEYLKEAFQLMAERKIITDETLAQLATLLIEVEDIDLTEIENEIFFHIGFAGDTVKPGILSDRESFMAMIRDYPVSQGNMIEF